MAYSHCIAGNSKIKLSDFNPEADGGLDRAAAADKMKSLIEELTELQELLYAANETSVLVVLQGRDTSGKDGTINGVFGPLSSIGCEVASFKVPTQEELSHDFLWRIHAAAPATGKVKIFNRSHYEDVLVARVHNLVAENVWRSRYEHINNFERLLADSGTTILKFCLHISKEEQEKRLLKREQDATKFWKLSVGDWKERQHWEAYTAAYEEAITECSAAHAPWYIVPANKKWFRNLAVAEALVDTLKPHKEKWLKLLEEKGKGELAAIKEFRQQSGARERKSQQ